MRKTKSIIALILLASVFTFCKKDDPEPEPEPTPVTPVNPGLSVNSTPQTQFEVDGVAYSYVQGNDTVLNTKTNDKVVVAANTYETVYHSSFTKKTKVYVKFSKILLKYTGNKTPAEPSFLNWFIVQDAAYATPFANGYKITWWDKNGEEWSTDKGTMDQSTSAFKVLQVKEVHNAFQEMVIYATFNCKLYNQSGNSKTVTNGKFVGNFENN